MPRLFQNHPAFFVRTESRDGAPEIQPECGLGEQQIQPADSLHQHLDLRPVDAQQFGELAQDAQRLSLLLFPQPNQLVVQVDGLQRFHEQRMPAAAGAVDDAVHFALLARHHRNHEAIVAKRDELFLQRAVVMMCPQESLERGLNLFLLPLDVAA